MLSQNSFKTFPVLCGLLAAPLALATTWTSASAGQCIEDIRKVETELDGDGNPLQAKDYLCRTQDGRSIVRAQFERLSGTEIGALLAGEGKPWFAERIGDLQIVKNEVWREYKALIDRFGVAADAESTAISLQHIDRLAAKKPNGATPAKRGISAAATVQPLVLAHLPQIALVDETIEILTTDRWPASLKFDYSQVVDALPLPNNPLAAGMTVWRYLTPEDVAQYGDRVKRYSKLVTTTWHPGAQIEPKGLALLRHLTTRAWPPNFLYTASSILAEEPCAVLEFRTAIYETRMDAIVIENQSAQDVTLDAAAGMSEESVELRERQSGRAIPGGEHALDTSTIRLRPGGKLLLPLRVSFRDVDLYANPSGSDQIVRDQQAAKVYSNIQNSPAGTVFKADIFDNEYKGAKKGRTPGTMAIRKLRESFGPHTPLTRRIFDFGTGWEVRSLVISGDTIPLKSGAASFLDLTAGDGIGSCPVLYAWDAGQKIWLRHGKVIDAAQSKAKEGSQTVAYDGLVTRFKIAEEELELSYLNQVSLVLEMAGGLRREVKPDLAALAARDGDYLNLHADEAAEIAFALPEDIDPAAVQRSLLTATGYYDRYAAILAERLLQSEPRQEAIPARR